MQPRGGPQPARELETDLVLTTDRRDFEVYRIGDAGPFRILP